MDAQESLAAGRLTITIWETDDVPRAVDPRAQVRLQPGPAVADVRHSKNLCKHAAVGRDVGDLLDRLRVWWWGRGAGGERLGVSQVRALQSDECPHR